MRAGKRDEQNADTEHDPSLVRVPKRTDGFNHTVFFVVASKREQNANAKIIAV